MPTIEAAETPGTRRRARRPAAAILKAVAVISALGPIGWIVYALLTGGLGADPVRKMQDVTGLTTIILLYLTLFVTPARRLSGWNELIKVRRTLGLLAFGYASLHATIYFVFDQQLSPADILADVVKHPWVTVGFTAWLILIPLAATSSNRMVRRLGGPRWRRLHQLVYLAGLLGALHFLWLVKKDISGPLIVLGVFAMLMTARLPTLLERARVALASRPR